LNGRVILVYYNILCDRHSQNLGEKINGKGYECPGSAYHTSIFALSSAYHFWGQNLDENLGETSQKPWKLSPKKKKKEERRMRRDGVIFL
jgi:hypothetical protein